MAFFNKHSSPDSKLSFFQNYSHHLNYIDNKLLKEFKKLGAVRNQGNITTDTAKELALGHLQAFDALRDGYDYMDDVLGATAGTAAGLLLSFAGAIYGLYEGLQALAIKVGFMDNDNEDHSENATAFFAVSGITLLATTALFINSAVSLITRPVVTAFQGWKPQDTDRFIDELAEEESLSAQIMSM